MSSASISRSQRSLVLRLAAVIVCAAGAAPALAASVTLCAAPYPQNLPGPNGTPVSVSMWGYSLGACGAATPSSPGPVLVVPPGDTTLTVTLQNNLTVPTSLVIAGQALPAGGAPVRAADVVGPACAEPTTDVACRVRSFTGETAPGATGTYVFNNLKPGTYLYQSGTHPQVQVQMGLFGLATLDGQGAGAPQRQLTTNPNTIIDADVPVVLSEIDPDQHARIQSTLGSTDLATQQTWQTGRNSTFDYNPRYFLVNGKPYDGAGATDLPAATFNGGYVALRMANAGLRSRSLVLTKGHWQLMTEDGNDYAAPREQYSVLLPAGKTTDARLMVTVPATGSSRIAFFDRRGGTDNGTTDPLGGQVAQLVLSNGGSAPPNIVDLAITKTNGVAVVTRGAATTYTIVASNNGPNPVTGAIVTDAMPAELTAVGWTCTASAGSSCPASGTGSIAASVNLLVGGTATFTVNATVALTAAGTLANTASIAVPAGFSDRLPLNNSATDSDPIFVPTADVAIATTDGSATAVAGGTVTYTVTVNNPGALGTGAGQSNTAVTATVVDTVPATLTGVTWTCAATAGSSCPASGTGSINVPVTLAQGGTATFTLRGSLASTATGTLANTATVTLPANVTDPNTANNTSADSDTVVAFPSWAVLDAFNRTTGLGGNWQQAAALVGINANEATCTGLLCGVAPGTAYWNAAGSTFGARQGASFLVTNNPVVNGQAPVNGSSLILKAGSGTTPLNFIRVRYNAGNVLVETTNSSGLGYATAGTLAQTLVTGDRLTAMVDATGMAYVWRTTAANATGFVGTVQLPVTGLNAFTTGTGRIGIQVPANGRVDNFSGGTVAP